MIGGVSRAAAWAKANEETRVVELAIMVEGQDGLNWPRWQRLALAVEELGFAGLYRSDHFTNPEGPALDALDLWTSLGWLASQTKRIEFGPLVSPVSFRHPVVTAWTAAAVDDLSGGRLRLGLGAGWQEREHRSFGFDLLETDRRFVRFEEGLAVVRSLLQGDEPVSFRGEFYQLDAALLLPRPRRPGGPPIVIGGNGPKRTLPLAARYADEWNAVFVPAARFEELNARLDGLLDEAGREPGEVRRTLMTRVLFGRDETELRTKLEGQSVVEARDEGLLVGGAEELVEQVGRLGEAGVERVMLQWLELDDINGLEALASSVLPRV
jgi:F420-dependent oxidoreductase-like protein